MRKTIIAALAAGLMLSAVAHAGNKFPNKDTAKNRQDNAWGTQKSYTDSNTEIGKDDASGDTTIRVDSGPKKEPVDWYDKIIITVNPDTKWPESGSATTTTTTYDNATDTQTTTTTDQEW